MGVGLAVTAAANGATVANHVEVIQLLKDESQKISGAKLRDKLSGETWEVQAKVVVNATGSRTVSFLFRFFSLWKTGG